MELLEAQVLIVLPCGRSPDYLIAGPGMTFISAILERQGLWRRRDGTRLLCHEADTKMVLATGSIVA